MLSLIDRALQSVPPVSRLVDSLAAALLPRRVAAAGTNCPPAGSTVCWHEWCDISTGKIWIVYDWGGDCNNPCCRCCCTPLVDC